MSIDWQSLFTPTTPVLELVLRGSMMYLLLFAALRVLVRRHVGSMSLMDLLLMVLIADAAQNAMAGQYESITEGIIVCSTLIFWTIFWIGCRTKFRSSNACWSRRRCRSSATASCCAATCDWN